MSHWCYNLYISQKLTAPHKINHYFLNLTLILLRLFQQHYCYNLTGQSQESKGSYKPARIKQEHSKLHSFQASLCTLTATHLTLIYVCTYIRLSVPLGCLIKQAGIIIHTILNLWETPEIEPVTSGLTSVYQTSTSTIWAIPPLNLAIYKPLETQNISNSRYIRGKTTLGIYLNTFQTHISFTFWDIVHLMPVWHYLCHKHGSQFWVVSVLWNLSARSDMGKLGGNR